MLAPRYTPTLVSAVVGIAIGLASSSLVAGFFAFAVTLILIQATLDATERLARRSPARHEELVRAQVRSTGITEWRMGGGGDVFSEPVLVTWHDLRHHEVYDQHGKLLATGIKRREADRSRIRQLLGMDGLEWSTPDGRPLAMVSPNRGWNPRFYTASRPEGTELGTVVTAGKEKGLICAAGATVGYVRRPSVGRRLRTRCPGFNLYDAGLVEVGRITHKRRFARWTVIEVDSHATGPLRNLLLAADAAIDWWEQPKGGG